MGIHNLFVHGGWHQPLAGAVFQKKTHPAMPLDLMAGWQ